VEDIMKTYFGFALADSMFNGDCTINRRSISVEEVKERVAQGKATIDAMTAHYGIEVTIPEAPPRVSLGSGDSVIVMGVRGLPRLTDRHEYTEEEIAKASFLFAEYRVS
jgi:predicted DNA-binding transcriptional regulator AlpA